MSFKTPFTPENRPKDLANFGFYKIQRHTKSALIGMIENFFDSINSEYSIMMPEIIGTQNNDEITKIFIKRDFPFTERKLPLIVVATQSIKEKKMYIGVDNLLTYAIRETSTGKTAVDIYHGAANVTSSIIIICQSPEERMKYADLLNMCFTHYYRWQYFYTLGDNNTFSIVPNVEGLAIGSEQEAKDISPESLLYITDITMTSFIEYTFSDIDPYYELKNLTIDEESGPIEAFDEA
jgi:hypothetical protein